MENLSFPIRSVEINMKKQYIIVPISFVLCVFIIVMIVFLTPTKICESGTYHTEDGESIEISLDVKRHKSFGNEYYSGTVTIDDVAYQSVYDLYGAKSIFFVVKKDIATESIKNNLALTEFRSKEKVVRLIALDNNGISKSFIGPADSYEAAMALYYEITE